MVEAASMSSDYYQLSFTVDLDEEDSQSSSSNQMNGHHKKMSDGSMDSMRGMQMQLGQLASENLSLSEKYMRQAEELSDIRAQLRGYSAECEAGASSDNEVVRLEAIGRGDADTSHSARLEVFNVPEFSKILVCDLKPRLAKLLTPHFPAYLLITAFRYHDEQHDETSLTNLFSTVHIMLKDTISNSQDIDILALWMVNTWRLYNLLRQYGEHDNMEWQGSNTEAQNAQRMRNIDLEPVRQQVATRVEDCYQILMKKAIEPMLTTKIVPALLLHETPSLAMFPGSGTHQNGANSKALDELITLLNYIHSKLCSFGADDCLLEQVFGRLAEWHGALALNHLVFRKDLCCFDRAVQIKHNVQEVMTWFSSKGFAKYNEALEPIVQACHLLQSRKDESNIDVLCGEMTNLLLPRQVVSILQHYTVSEDFEESVVQPDFIDRVEAKLVDRGQDPKKLIMRGTYLPPFDASQFVHSDFKLETLSLPTYLQLHQVARLL